MSYRHIPTFDFLENNKSHVNVLMHLKKALFYFVIIISFIFQFGGIRL
jgi:hypothetical protein